MFLSKDNLCTRFATKLILQRSLAALIKIRIVLKLKKQRLDINKERLLSFRVLVFVKTLQLKEVIKLAKEAIRINNTRPYTVALKTKLKTSFF